MTLKPRIAESPQVRLIDLRSKPFFVVASVEVGNTTTKSILTAKNMDTGMTCIINKVVRMTRDVCPPKPGEAVFGKTLTGVGLTREAVAELVRDTLIESIEKANLDIKRDLNFVVRSTGVVAGFDSAEEVGEFIKALADGCLIAGVSPKNMTPPMSITNISRKFRKYSNLEKVIFDGAVAEVMPPMGSTVIEIVANEWREKTTGNFCGYAGAIPDAIVRGSKLVDPKVGTALEILEKQKLPSFFTLEIQDYTIEKYVENIRELIIIVSSQETLTRNISHIFTPTGKRVNLLPPLPSAFSGT